MARACENCRFCIYAHSMRGKDEPYCERHSKWIGDTLLCSEWEMVSVPKPQTNADRIRAMSDDELAEWLASETWKSFANGAGNVFCSEEAKTEKAEWLDWLKQEVISD